MTCDMKELFVAFVTFRHFSIYRFPHTTLAQNDVQIRICSIQFLSVLYQQKRSTINFIYKTENHFAQLLRLN